MNIVNKWCYDVVRGGRQRNKSKPLQEVPSAVNKQFGWELGSHFIVRDQHAREVNHIAVLKIYVVDAEKHRTVTSGSPVANDLLDIIFMVCAQISLSAK